MKRLKAYMMGLMLLFISGLTFLIIAILFVGAGYWIKMYWIDWQWVGFAVMTLMSVGGLMLAAYACRVVRQKMILIMLNEKEFN